MKIILVTGGNRGIGLEVCRQLDELGHRVIMGSRNPDQGSKACRTLSDRSLAVQLDSTDEESIYGLAALVAEKYGRIDVLVNNAALGTDHKLAAGGLRQKARSFVRNNLGGIARTVHQLKNPKDTGHAGIRGSNVDLHLVKVIMETNYYGPWRMIQAFLPLLAESDDGRIINISSGLGALDSLDGNHPGYSQSKAALNALTVSFARELQGDGILVNAVDPGWVRTRMGGPNAPRTVEQGADTIVWLATTDHGMTGKFFRDRKEIPW
jgi:NAD(P)-dependent dehydrogenase (short-subunit alcohol dehydrogenase family)